MSPPRECLYTTLNLPQTASTSDIRKAYRTLALSHHPDKNPGQEATSSENFKSIQHAYSVLSDEHERAWYDAHREQILRGHDPATTDPDKPPDPADATNVDLFACFSSSAYRGFADGADGFYGVYDDVFDRLWQEEVAEMTRGGKGIPPAASFGGVAAGWETVRQFYARWDAFSSVKSFAFADKWNMAEAPNREVRRLMDKDNKKARATMRKEFNSTVRELAAFVKKRDPRVARRRKDEQDVREQKQKLAKERERAKAQLRKDNADNLRAARDEALEEDADGLDQILEALALDERIEAERKKAKKKRRGNREAVSASDDEISRAEAASDADADSADGADDKSENRDATDAHVDEVGSDTGEDSGEEQEEDLYCAACRKPFRTAAQKTDHERSKKHKSAVAKLRRQLLKEEKAFAKANPTLETDLSASAQPAEIVVGDPEHQEQSVDGSENDASNDEEEAQYLRAKAKKSKKKRKKQFAQSFVNPTDDDDASGDDIANGLKPSNTNGDAGSPHLDAVDRAQFAATENADDIGDSETPTETKQPKLTKKQQRRLREQSKKERGEAGKPTPSSLKCNVCSGVFPSRTKLMRHVEQSGHALHVPETPRATDGKRK